MHAKMIRGGGDPLGAHGSYRGREWARLRGASPLMRMAASWSDARDPLDHPSNTRLWRDRRHVMAGSPLINLVPAARPSAVQRRLDRVSGAGPPSDAPPESQSKW